MAKCYICGTEDAETWRFCSSKGQFVCISCEKVCNNYSAKLLPGGVNCKIRSTGIDSRFWSYLTNRQEVIEAKQKYESLTIEELRERYKSIHATHQQCEDSKTRVKLRIELAAMCEVANERKMECE